MSKNTLNIKTEWEENENLDTLLSKSKTQTFETSKVGKQIQKTKICTKTEMEYIIPKNPLLKHGQLLSTKKLINEDEFYGSGFQSIGIAPRTSNHQSNYNLQLQACNDIIDFFDVGYKMDSVITVCGEKIAVIKETSYEEKTLNTKRKCEIDTTFYFCHYIDIITKGIISSIKTSMFTSDNNQHNVKFGDDNDIYRSFYSLKELDMKIIEKKYLSTEILKLINPLEIIK